MADARLLAFVAAAAMAVAPGCGAAPTPPMAPTPAASTVTAPVVGSWTGTFDIATCTGRCFGATYGPERISLRLSGSNGVLLIGPPVSLPLYPLVIDVTSVGVGTGFVITGQGPVPWGRYQLGALDVRIDLSSLGETIAGTVSYTLTANDGVRTIKQGSIISGGRETSVTPARFHGLWGGRMTRTSCVGDCEYDPFISDGSIQLDIAQSDTAVTASYNSPVPTLIGTANATAINLSYRKETPGCHFESEVDTYCLLEISISGVADALDRLTGTMTYHLDWIAEKGTGRYVFTGTADLTRVARWR